MAHLTPEILRAAALRLWDGQSANDAACYSMAEAVQMVAGSHQRFRFVNYVVQMDGLGIFDGLSVAQGQAARFDFLNLLACSLEE